MRRFPLLPFNTICSSVIYSGPRAVDASGLFYSLVACTSPEIPRVQKCNSFQTQASDVNTATALSSPPSSPAFKFKCSLLALGEQIYCISSALFFPPCVILSASPSAYCFYSAVFVSDVFWLHSLNSNYQQRPIYVQLWCSARHWELELYRVCHKQAFDF